MIQSLDGKQIKRGEICFVIGITTDGVYSPCRCKAHSRNPSYSVPDESKVYSTYKACQDACDLRNKNKEK